MLTLRKTMSVSYRDAHLGLTSLIKEAKRNLEMFPEFLNSWETVWMQIKVSALVAEDENGNKERKKKKKPEFFSAVICKGVDY